MYNNVFYYSRLMPIGGIETWLWNLGKKYGKTHDLVLFYSRADEAQLHRLQQVIRCIPWTGQRIQCRRAFWCYDANIMDSVDAEEHILLLHGDYKALGIKPPSFPKVTRVVGVSQVACDSYKELTGQEAELCYNPLIVQKPKKVLRLISATRMSVEKGIRRIDPFAEILERAGIPFTWDVYSDTAASFKSPYVTRKPARLDIIDLIASADYLVQLSTTEGLPYVLSESLSVGTPVIVTDYPAAREIGVVDGVNGFILPMDLQGDLPLAAIRKGLKKFKYTAPADRWSELLAEGPGTYMDEIAGTVQMKVISPYFDTQQQQQMAKGAYLRAKPERAAVLIEHGVAIQIPDV